MGSLQHWQTTPQASCNVSSVDKHLKVDGPRLVMALALYTCRVHYNLVPTASCEKHSHGIRAITSPRPYLLHNHGNPEQAWARGPTNIQGR